MTRVKVVGLIDAKFNIDTFCIIIYNNNDGLCLKRGFYMSEQNGVKSENGRFYYVFHAKSDNLPEAAKAYVRPYDAVTVGVCPDQDFDRYMVGTERGVDWTCNLYPNLTRAMDHVRDFDLSTVTFMSGEGDDKLTKDELKFISDYINEHYEMLASVDVMSAETKNYPRTAIRHVAHDRLGEKLAKCKSNGLNINAALAPDRMLSNEYKQDLISVSGEENRSCDAVFETQAKNTYRFSTKAMSDMTRADITNDEMRDKLNDCLAAIRDLDNLGTGITPDFSLSEEEQIQVEAEVQKAKEEIEEDKLRERIRVADSIIKSGKSRDKQMSL